MLKDHLERKEDSYSKGSRKKLSAAMTNKIKRTFVGCLDVVERELGEDSEEFKRIRRKVLGIGNDQIRNMQMELEKYNVEFIPYHIELEVKPIDGLDIFRLE
jgi:hypothetical protein